MPIIDDSDVSKIIMSALASAIRPILREEVVAALAEHAAGEAPRPELLDRAGIARALDVAPAMVTKLKTLGMPFLLVGDQPKYRIHDCLKWLERRTRDEVDLNKTHGSTTGPSDSKCTCDPQAHLAHVPGCPAAREPSKAGTVGTDQVIHRVYSILTETDSPLKERVERVLNLIAGPPLDQCVGMAIQDLPPAASVEFGRRQGQVKRALETK